MKGWRGGERARGGCRRAGKNGSGGSAVWVRDGAERFVLRTVEGQALDAATAVVIAGLRDGERVVTVGASLLSQVR